MTMSAARVDGQPTAIRVTATYGSITNTITEDVGHLVGFRDHLTRLIDEIAAETASSHDAADA